MPTADSLKTLEDQFRNRILADRLEEAASLFDLYVAELDRELRGQAGAERVRALEVQTARLIEWASVMASASRQRSSHASSQLRSLARYEVAGAPCDLDARG